MNNNILSFINTYKVNDSPLLSQPDIIFIKPMLDIKPVMHQLHLNGRKTYLKCIIKNKGRFSISGLYI